MLKFYQIIYNFLHLYKDVLYVCVIFSETPLHAAALDGDLDLSTLLLQHGADPNLQDNNR